MQKTKFSSEKSIIHFIPGLRRIITKWKCIYYSLSLHLKYGFSAQYGKSKRMRKSTCTPQAINKYLSSVRNVHLRLPFQGALQKLNLGNYNLKENRFALLSSFKPPASTMPWMILKAYKYKEKVSTGMKLSKTYWYLIGNDSFSLDISFLQFNINVNFWKIYCQFSFWFFLLFKKENFPFFFWT